MLFITTHIRVTPLLPYTITILPYHNPRAQGLMAKRTCSIARSCSQFAPPVPPEWEGTIGPRM